MEREIMGALDRRTRFEGDAVSLDPNGFFEKELAPLLAERADAGLSVSRLGLPSLTLDVQGEARTLVSKNQLLIAEHGDSGSLVVTLDRAAFSDLVQDEASTFALVTAGRATVERGDVDAFIGWEPVLRYLLDGRPVYEPGSITFHSRDGSALDLSRSFTMDDDPDEIGNFLAEAGFLHIEGVFTAEEMAAVSVELEKAVSEDDPDDGASWWARTKAGERYPARILGFNHKSPTLRSLLRSDRFARLACFGDDQYSQRDPDDGDSAEGLLKKVGVVEGISDVSWHKDCSMGGHSRHCCALTVGISVTGAGRENGELGVVAGSHRATVALLGIDGLDLPRLPLPTATGDITVHASCTLHMSRPPISAERRVVYTGFDLTRRPEDHADSRSKEEVRRGRAGLNSRARAAQQERARSTRMSSFEL
jgi:hypothetical protein